MMRRAPLLIALAAILLTTAWWYLLYQPRRVEQAAYVEQTAQLESERQQLQAQIVTLREVEKNQVVYRSQLERLVEYIPDDPGQPAALKALQQAADSSGVELSQTTFSDPELVEDAPETNEELTALARIPMQVTVDGGYFQVVDLLRRIEVNLARAVKVSAVTMAEEAEESFPDLTITLSGHIYAVLPVLETAGEQVEIVEPEGQSSESPGDTPSEQPSEGAAATEPAASESTTDGGTS